MHESKSDKYSFLDEKLAIRREEKRFRTLKELRPINRTTVRADGRELLNFCSNDYLALSGHPAVVQRSCEYAQKFGAGAGASRLVSGSYTIHQELEEKIARMLDKEAALLFNSGFQANSTILGTLAGRHSIIIADKLSHYSLLQGALSSRADFKRFEHNDLGDLERLLQQAKEQSYRRILVAGETVFSMDGDRSDIAGIAELANRYNALLFVDDAHAFGVWGEEGRGLAYDIPGVDLILGTCGKALGSFGAFVACSDKMRDYLINFCPGFIYTTSLPPAVVGAIDAAVELISGMDDLRSHYHRNVDYLRNSLQDMGFDTGPSDTQIIPVITGGDDETLRLSNRLQEQGILATAIRPPTVPENSGRIRLALSAAHGNDQIEYLLTKMQEWRDD